jgi:hypothetical protein
VTLAVVTLVVALTLGACLPRPDHPNVGRPGFGVTLDPASLPVNRLRVREEVRFHVSPKGDLPVVEVRVRIPDRVEHLGSMQAPPWPFDIPLRLGGVGPPTSRWSVKLEPEQDFATVVILISHPTAQVGEVLTFPVELVRSDGSVVRWDGAPGSDRPTPTGVVVPPPTIGRGALIAAGFAGGLSLLVLLVTGAWAIRLRVVRDAEARDE